MKTKLNNLITRYMSMMGLTLYAIPLEVDATAHAALPEATRSLYVASNDGKFKLDVAGLEDTAGLKTALQKERDAVKEAKAATKKQLEDALAPFAGIDPVKTKELFAKFENADEAALIAAGKIDEVLSKRMEKHNAAQQKILDGLTKERDGALEVASTFMERVLDNHIRASAAKAGVHAGAIDDALLRARSLFSLDDDGNAVQFDEDGENVVLGKDGKTPFNPDEWMEGMKEAAPHWFPAGASGGGAGGSGKGAGGAKTMKRSAFEALDPISKATAMKEKIALVD